MVSAYNTPWVICTKYVLSNYFTTLGIIYSILYTGKIVLYISDSYFLFVNLPAHRMCKSLFYLQGQTAPKSFVIF